MRVTCIAVALSAALSIGRCDVTVQRGTAIVALSVQDGIVLAADSRSIDVDPKGRILQTSDDECKIRVLRPDLVAATAGFTHLPNGVEALDQIARDMGRGSALPLWVGAEGISEYARKLFEDAPALFDRLPGGMRPGAVALEIVLLGIVKGRPHLEWRGIAIKSVSPFSVGFAGRSLSVAEMTGQGYGSARASAVLFRSPAFASVETASEEARRVLAEVAQQADVVPWVGGPTDVVAMTTKGITGTMKPQCPMTPPVTRE